MGRFKDLALLFILLTAYSCGEGKREEIKRGFDLAVWAEFLPYDQYHAVFPELQKLDVELFLAIREEQIDRGSLKKLKFRAWLLLKEENGYWLSTWNADKFYDFLREFLQSGIDVEWITLDLEPPFDASKKLSFSKSLTEYLSALNQMKPPDDIYNHGKSKIDEIISFAHSKGVKVLCSLFPFAVDDLEDGDQDILRFIGLYIPPDCDEYSFMLYTTILKNLAGKLGFKIEVPEYFVYSYGVDIYRLFGERGSIDVGLVGEDLFGNKGYSTPDELKRDVSAGLAAGLKKIHVWTLDNMRENGRWEVRKWLDLVGLKPVVPPPDEAIDRIRDIFRTLDQAL